MKYFSWYRFLIFLGGLVICGPLQGQNIVRYDLYVQDTMLHVGKQHKMGVAVNGQIPMPTLEFTQGDTAEIVVHNGLKVPTSLHWHGIFVPNKEDGVPYLTQMPIAPGGTYTYRFPIIQNGTHWYHSHSGMQEQIGMYGSFIIHKRSDDPEFRPGIDDLPTENLILSEWTNIMPMQVQRMLHFGSDWFAIEKGATQSYSEAIGKGHFKTKLENEWKRMHAMDVSDVAYDQVWINGRKTGQLSHIGSTKLQAGDKLRLRISNGGASSYFWLSYGGGKITVVASDGNDVEPVEVDRLLIAVSETYDIMLEIPEDGKAYGLLATTEDRTRSASLYLGSGSRQSPEPMPALDYFEGMKMMNDMMRMNGEMDDMGMNMSMQSMDMNAVMYPELEQTSMDNRTHEGHHGHERSGIKTLNYGMLEAPKDTRLDAGAEVKQLEFTLTGNMNRYLWSMDNRVLSESDKIPVKQGQILRLVLKNNSMMRHPMHLHGFDFRVLNGKGTTAPLKNVLDIMPMETDTIEFAANREGDWFFHCHILYHMMAGMNRVFAVGDYQNPYLSDKARAYKKLQAESNALYFRAENDFSSNGLEGEAELSNTRWSLQGSWEMGYHADHAFEGEVLLGRYLGKTQWLMPFIGLNYRDGHVRESRNYFGQAIDAQEALFSLGFRYTLPMWIDLQAEVFHNGNLRFSLMRSDIPITPRLRGALMFNTDREYGMGLHYILSRNLGISVNYDSERGFGAGLILEY